MPHPSEMEINQFVASHPDMPYAAQFAALKGRGLKFNTNLLSTVRKQLGIANSTRMPKKVSIKKSNGVVTLLTTSQVAKFADCHTSTVVSSVHGGRLRPVGAIPAKGGGAYIFRKITVEKWIKNVLRRMYTTPKAKADKKLREKITKLEKENTLLRGLANKSDKVALPVPA